MLVYHNYMFIFRRFGCSLLIPDVIIVIYSYFQTSAGIIFAQALKWLFDITILKVFFLFFLISLYLYYFLPMSERKGRIRPFTFQGIFTSHFPRARKGNDPHIICRRFVAVLQAYNL